MIISVQGVLIDTKDIYGVADISNSRTAGFVINLIGKEDVRFSKSIPYESYPEDIRRQHEPYDKLRKQVIEYWEKDKTEIPVLKL